MIEALNALGWIGAGLAALMAALAAAFWRGGRAERNRHGAQDARNYRDTRKRMDDASDHLGDDPATLRDWLRERGGDKR